MNRENTLKINNFVTVGKTQSLWMTMKDDKNDITTWDQFTENTSFHGVRYTFNKTFFKLQRQVKVGSYYTLLVYSGICAPNVENF